MSGYAIARLDEIEEISDGRCPFRPVRHHFGITSFGINAWTGREAGDRIINEHDEADEHEELYFVSQGRAVFELDGERREAPAGSFVFVERGVRRTAFAEEAGTTLLAVGGEPGRAYEPSGYEVWSQLGALFQAGEYEAVADRGRELIAQNPQYPTPIYNVACAEALAGRKEDAIEHLRQAIALSERFREYAKGDSDFDSIRDEPSFQELVGQ
jgi:mannose-6-phosphate isomerase-like protein (cupin superfamily)